MGQTRNFLKNYRETQKEFYNPKGEKPLFRIDDTGKTFICPVCGLDVPRGDMVSRLIHEDGWVAHYECVSKITQKFGKG
jgi:hypothetical protein